MGCPANWNKPIMQGMLTINAVPSWFILLPHPGFWLCGALNELSFTERRSASKYLKINDLSIKRSMMTQMTLNKGLTVYKVLIICAPVLNAKDRVTKGIIGKRLNILMSDFLLLILSIGINHIRNLYHIIPSEIKRGKDMHRKEELNFERRGIITNDWKTDWRFCIYWNLQLNLQQDIYILFCWKGKTLILCVPFQQRFFWVCWILNRERETHNNEHIYYISKHY